MRPGIFAFLLLGACEVDRPCDPGFHEVHGACFKDVVACAECSEDAYSGFGCPCILSDAGPGGAGPDGGPGCECQADYCAVNPGADQGFCTKLPTGDPKTDCSGDATVCPQLDNWECFDTSAVGGPGNMCVCSDINLDTYTCPDPVR